MKLRIKLIHLIRMTADETYRIDQEHRARFARVMAANKSIMAGRETGCQQNATNTLNPLYNRHCGTSTHGLKIRTTKHYMSGGTRTMRQLISGMLNKLSPEVASLTAGWSKILQRWRKSP